MHIIYVIDLLNLWLIVWLWKDREKCKQYFGLLKIYLGIILVLVITGCVYYGEWEVMLHLQQLKLEIL